MPAEAYDEAYRSISNAGFVLDNMAASKSQPIANEFKLARSAGHDFAGYPAFWERCAAGIYPNTLGKATYP